MIRNEIVMLAVVCCGFGLLCGYCAGVAVTRYQAAQIIYREREAKRLALDAAVASAVMTEPTPHECAEASRSDGDYYRAVIGPR